MNRVILTFLIVFLCLESLVAAGAGDRIVSAARKQIGVTTSYDPSYVKLEYPGGDVPIAKGVCTDVVVRAIRHVGIDLQKTVHEDMRVNFKKYPQNWGLKRPDKNIDHRRVPNLQKYFERKHIVVARKSTDLARYQPGDVVAWSLGRGILHIGIVSDKKKGNVPLVIHNIGSGTREEDILQQFKVIGHYRLKANR